MWAGWWAHPRQNPDVVAEHQDAGLQAHQVEEEALGTADLGVSRPNQEDPQRAIHQVGAEVEEPPPAHPIAADR